MRPEPKKFPNHDFLCSKCGNNPGLRKKVTACPRSRILVRGAQCTFNPPRGALSPKFAQNRGFPEELLEIIKCSAQNAGIITRVGKKDSFCPASCPTPAICIYIVAVQKTGVLRNVYFMTDRWEKNTGLLSWQTLRFSKKKEIHVGCVQHFCKN